MFDSNDPLRVEFLDGTKGGRWRLTEPFAYFDDEGDYGTWIDVPAGFVTDFASVPRLLWPFYPKTGSYAKAAVVHDWLYFAGYIRGVGPVTRSYADAVFKRAMEDLGVPYVRRHLMWLAVRAGAGSTWARYRAADPEDLMPPPRFAL